MSRSDHLAYIGIGANLGDRVANMTRAVEMLAEGGVEIMRRSSIFETSPFGCDLPQDDYLNAVIEVRCGCEAVKLLEQCAAIESRLGRERWGKNQPRVIDLDILLFDDLVIDSKRLALPHPRMHERRFVLQPLAEIAPHVLHPVIGKSAQQLLALLADCRTQEVRNMGVTDW